MCPSRRADGTLVFKLVFWGPSMGGKTTALAWVYEKEGLASGQLQSISDPTGRTLFFDRLVAKVSNVVFQVYTVAGQRRHKFQRQTVLKGTDALVFFWDSDQAQWNENIYSLKELLQMYGNKVLSSDIKIPPEVPLIVCANKRDLPNITGIDKIKDVLKAAKMPNTVIFETVAITGTNVKRAFVYAARECVLRHYQKLKSGEQVPPASPETEPTAPGP
nr:GTPase domain-containing protein [Candidatus Sigynarchaeota archaeon]